MTTDSQHYMKYNTVHTNTKASKQIANLPVNDSDLVAHVSLASESDVLLKILVELRKKTPDLYYGEIYSKVLPAGPMRDNYRSAALNTARTPIDNKTRYYLQLTLVRYIIMHGRNFKCFSLGEFSYALHEYAFRISGNTATIGLLPWAFLESANVTKFNVRGLSLGDYLIKTAIEELNPPNGKISKVGLLIRQYIDYTSQLWRPVLKGDIDIFGNTVTDK